MNTIFEQTQLPNGVTPSRVVLEGVPRVGFYQGGPRPPEDDPFPSCLRAYLEYRGDDLGFKQKNGGGDPWHEVHVYLMGISGAAWRMTWDAREWNMGAGDLLAASANPFDGLRRAFEAAGYGCEIVLRRDFAQAHGVAQEQDYSDADFRRLIVQSIRDKGRPVIAFGVIGPPECGLITGYDEGGDVLMGWNYFQSVPEFQSGVECEPSGYYRRRNWFDSTPGLILIGNQRQRSDAHEVNRATLRAALEYMRAPAAQGMLQGQAAFSRWADLLLQDDLFPVNDTITLNQRYDVHHSTAGTLAEARAWGAWFLHMLSAEEPSAAVELEAAAKCFDNQHDLVWAIWEFTRTERSGHMTAPGGAQRFADAGIRGRIVPLIRLARKEDAEAAQHLETALIQMGDATPRTTPGRYGRAVLDGVPCIGYDVHTCPLPGSLYALLQYVGMSCDYDYLMGVSGAAFRRLWNRDDGGNVDLMYLAPEPYQRMMQALNLEYHAIPKDRAQMIAAIQESISRGRPVISFGMIGPPEAGLITGYDDGGDTLIGWSYFQGDASMAGDTPFEPSGYYRRPNWFVRMDAGGPTGLLVIDDRQRWAGPSARQILIHALRWALDLERTARRAGLPDHICGLSAYEMWARGLETDADYPPTNRQELGQRAMIHADQCVMLHERESAARFLRSQAGVAPEAAEALEAAAGYYAQAAAEGVHLWPWRTDMAGWNAAMDALADPAARRSMALHVRMAGTLEAKATEKLEQALASLEA
jgi:hypothetical protein